ncbi:MAG: DEAD/DEAH box helicase [Elainellaceae cyanobacterium]
MTYTAADADQVRSLLAKVYEGLPPLEKVIAQLFAVIYEPVNRTLLVNCLNHLEAKERGGKHFTAPSVKPYLDRLQNVEVIVQQSGYGPQCHPLLTEIITRDAVKTGRFDSLVTVAEKGFPLSRRWKDGPFSFSNDRQLIRAVRVGIYRQDLKLINRYLEDYYRYGYQSDKIEIGKIYQQVYNNPFDSEWVRLLTPELQEGVLVTILNDSLLNLVPAEEAFLLLKERCTTAKSQASIVEYAILIEQLIFRGKLPEAQQVLEQLPADDRDRMGSVEGWLAFLQGENEQAIDDYSDALRLLKKTTRKKKIYFQSIEGPFYILALLKSGDAKHLQEAVDYASIARQAKHWLSTTYALLENVVSIQRGDLAARDAVLYAPYIDQHSFDILFHALCLYWVDADAAKKKLPKTLEPFYEQAQAAGYTWLAMEAAELLAQLKPKSQYSKQAAVLRQGSESHPLANLVQAQEAWELCLNALASFDQPEAAPQAKSETNQRLVWFLTFYPSGCVLQPREQTLTAKGGWSKGRPIALKRLKNESEEFSYLTPQDLRLCAQIKTYTYGWRNQIEYTFSERAIAALVGHPYVFWEDAPNTRVEVVKGEPELLVKKSKDDRLTLEFSPELKENQDILTIKESPTRLKVIELTPEHRRIAEILGKQNRLEVPAAAKERVLAAINAVSSIVTVHSDIGGGVASQEVPADSRPHIHLLPASTGLKVAVLSRPFAEGGPYYRPGTGGETVIAEIEGKRLQTTRNLREEKKQANAAIAACPTLARQEQEDNEWLVEDPEDCLELLLELQALGEQASIEWPEGEKLRVSHQATFKDFSMAIKRQNDWFATDGKLQVGDGLVLDMQQLMQLLDQTSSRFIPLGEGQFLALTQEFRKRLDELRAFAERSGKGLRLHPLAAVAVGDWMEEVGSLKADKHWKAHIKQLKELQDFEPQLPSTLQAELRDYQLDGFRWLARLAHWGVGACLADDMGLGKTLQALALILTRAPEGPTLIVAPTSVCMNWLSEAQRFAPTLNVTQFGSGDRQKVLDQLQPLDMLVCSYGLLQQEDVAEMLAKVQWQTIVLDEAQSIKNFATKRSQAAMSLQGSFKLLTTGTPVENHLGELWNLFRFINPGLLGSLDSFNQRFANPIERYGDRQARNRLKKLIQPFLLRRTKNQVLEELPSRTEILLHVDLSQEELAFYETLRREAIAKLSDSDATAGAKHLQVLAEIMRLRRACCNTRLVKPDLTLPSSKLQLFGEVLTELLENNHKALVFSQFVDHLQIIRDYLDSQKITYQYLDGSTPAQERKKRVDAFQAGKGDVFLISLKAGGTGLNLTAADYVIHMDPWWNPAVEDQASDRAHRIGQQRPVTIYRLVAKNTIEDKIVDLHQHKRDLADSLLEGAEMSGKMSTDELLQLIHIG